MFCRLRFFVFIPLLLAGGALPFLPWACGDNLPSGTVAATPPTVGSLLFVPTDIYNSSGRPAKPTAHPDKAVAAFDRSRDAVVAGRVSDAIAGACEAAWYDSDHAGARRLLGCQRIGEAWAGPFAQRQVGTGNLWRPQLGWIKEDDLAKYSQGLRPSGNKWIATDDDAKRHSTIDRGWVVRTDHFLITTDVDPAAGAELAVRLESIYQVWRQLFGEFAVTTAEMKSRLDGKDPVAVPPRPFRVKYYGDRAEYNAALKPIQPQIEMTLGIYLDVLKESQFFAGKEQDPGVIAHEAVHQFFHESRQASAHVGATANFWAVEGVACYFESLTAAPGAAAGVFTIGTSDAGRIPAARHRRVVDDYYVPLAELTKLGMTDVQSRPDIAKLYSQSAGLATFFMESKGGAYRQAFRDFLAAVYAGRDKPDTLSKLSGRSYEELDKEYLEFMKGLPIVAVIAPQ